jgi:lipoate-protein ligase A
MIGEALPVWWDEPADAFTNMAADELLAAEADRRGGLVVRLYGWEPASVSLGAFQEIAVARGRPEIAGLPIVRRPSGGGAIMHGSDLTYAAAIPRTHPWAAAAQPLYDAFHAALVAELSARGIAARQHRRAGGDDRDGRFLCFDRRAEGDVVVAATGGPADDDPKILGSAQRRLAGVVLQHGSLLLRANTAAGPGGRHPGILDLDPQGGLDVRDLAAAWLGRVARAAEARLDWQAEGFRVGRGAEITAAAGRFHDSRWLERR